MLLLILCPLITILPFLKFSFMNDILINSFLFVVIWIVCGVFSILEFASLIGYWIEEYYPTSKFRKILYHEFGSTKHDVKQSTTDSETKRDIKSEFNITIGD